MQIEGRTAVVTGGAGGIGAAISRALIRRGAQVVVADIEEERARETADSLDGDAVGHGCDVSDRDSVQSLARRAEEAFGPVHVLCNNAGVGVPTPITAIDFDTWDWILSVNLGGVVNGIAAFLPGMIDHGEPAHIVNTASEHALGLPFAGAAAYTASKHGVLAVSEALRAETADHDIGVSVLCPGLVRTDIWRSPERRPDTFGGSEPAPDGMAAMFEPGMDPDAVGEIVARGVEAEAFYLMTHSEVRAVADARCREVMQAFDALDAAGT